MTDFSCEQVFRRLNDFIDRELAPDEMRALERHLEQCAVCLSEYEFEKAVLDEVRGKLQKLPAPPSLKSRISQALDREE